MCSAVALICTKERNSKTCNNMDEPCRYYAKPNMLGTKQQMLYDFPLWSLKISQTQNQQVKWLSKSRGGVNGEVLFNMYRVTVLQDEKCSGVLLYNNLNILLKYTFKMVKKYLKIYN